MSLFLLYTDLAKEAGGYTISLVSIVVVFLSLVILILLFSLIPKLIKLFEGSKEKTVKVVPSEEASISSVSDSEKAAIAMALYLYLNEQHDEESYVITFARKGPTAWSLPIYNVLKKSNES